MGTDALPRSAMTVTARDLLAAFETRSPTEKHKVAAEILRRLAPDSDVSEAALAEREAHHMELSKIATGKPELIIARDVSYESFPSHAQQFVDKFGLTIEKKIDGPAERMWLVRFDGDTLCVSWDVWFLEVTVMAWDDTSADVLFELHRRA
jgi:hypothetical protein